MSYINTRFVITATKHECFGCGIVYPYGQFMVVIVWVDMGKILSTYWCKTCDTYYSEYSFDETERIDKGAILANDPEGWCKIRLKGK